MTKRLISWISDTLTIQVSATSSDEEMQPESSVECDTTIRSVKLRKQKEGGLGISIKVCSPDTVTKYCVELAYHELSSSKLLLSSERFIKL